jgi:hypothetical protein
MRYADLSMMAPCRLSCAGLNSEHWLLTFVEDLLGQFRASGDINFEAVQRLLQHHQQAFLKDLETARRMYRTYPGLFQQERYRHCNESKSARA